jgi:FMN phosphatase YigB (HAD superfamily)
VKSHQVAHVAEGVTEISPARRLGCATVWVRRRGRSARLLTEAPDLEVPALSSLLPHVGIYGGYLAKEAHRVIGIVTC